MNTITTLALVAHDGDWDGPPWFFFPFIPLIWIAVIASIWFFFGRHRWRRGRSSGESVLAERYARGEIDESEYRHRQSVLRDRK